MIDQRTSWMSWTPLVLGAAFLFVAAETFWGAHQTPRPTAAALAALDARTPPHLVRGPYLQRASAHGMVVRWRTAEPSPGRVRFGREGHALDRIVDGAGGVSDHIVALDGLAADTRYQYVVESGAYTLAGAATALVFSTAPEAGTNKRTRVWVLGDSGTADDAAASVRDAYLRFAAGRAPDVWLMLGDNAYNHGSDSEYQHAVFDAFRAILPVTALWPTRGNHERDESGSGSTYYDAFTLPMDGEAGGEPSGTEAYYAFDWGDIHFVCLDSFGSDRGPRAPMAQWLRRDLARRRPNSGWLIAFFHHPPYTKGTHDSDRERELIEMRTTFVPILEGAGVDLVLTGHSHDYERSFLIDGHEGPSSSFRAGMKKNSGLGRAGEPGSVYAKPAGGKAHAGTVYVVAGISGDIGHFFSGLNHPAMAIARKDLGSLVLDVDGPRLDATVVASTGAVLDSFTIVKN